MPQYTRPSVVQIMPRHLSSTKSLSLSEPKLDYCPCQWSFRGEWVCPSIHLSHFYGFHAFSDKPHRELISNFYGIPQACLTFGHLLLNSCHLLNFWLGEKLPYIYRQTTDLIELKFGGPIHYGPPLAWLTFGHSHCSMASDLSSRAPSQYKDRLIYVWRFPC